jgi:hypothetical protein
MAGFTQIANGHYIRTYSCIKDMLLPSSCPTIDNPLRKKVYFCFLSFTPCRRLEHDLADEVIASGLEVPLGRGEGFALQCISTESPFLARNSHFPNISVIFQ